MLWVEKYRPKTIAECILPKELKDTFQEYVNRKEIPNLLLSGSPGTGKSTIATALCKEVGCDYIIINGSDENGIDTLRHKITNYATSVSLYGGRKVVIIEEADYMNSNSLQPALRSALESFSNNCSFIFTCNLKNRIIEPLHSRCACIEFKITKEDKPKLMSQFFKRICNILDQEKVDYNKEVVAQLINKYHPDNRRILNELQRHSMLGSIDVGILSAVSDINITELIKSLKEKNFSNVRKWVSDNSDIDSTAFFRKLYDNAYDFLKPNSIPQITLIIAKYQYQSAFVADQELNNIAFLVELMIEMEFL